MRDLFSPPSPLIRHCFSRKPGNFRCVDFNSSDSGNGCPHNLKLPGLRNTAVWYAMPSSSFALHARASLLGWHNTPPGASLSTFNSGDRKSEEMFAKSYPTIWWLLNASATSIVHILDREEYPSLDRGRGIRHHLPPVLQHRPFSSPNFSSTPICITQVTLRTQTNLQAASRTL